MINPYTSRVLYHLVGRRFPQDDKRNYETLRKILRSMELRTNSVADKSGGITLQIDPNRGCIDGEPIAQTITCFCDIPFQSLALHTSKYGRFGVGVDRMIVAEWGGRPVSYIPTVPTNATAANNRFCTNALTVWDGLRKHFPEMPTESVRPDGAPPLSPLEAVDLASSFVSKSLAFVKTFNVNLPDDHPENFYMEREWRKLANLPLTPCLIEVVAPTEYQEPLRSEFAHLAHIPIRSVSAILVP
jgi:hypothetical protein